ncbi:MAG: hypothetical protein DWI57_06790 [Chloroflexi bacterium]|nr:MAG: hypothetical protein DWI57_06790 [Chloroflexota bacterium]
MTLDPSFIQRNQASTNRIRALAARLTDDDLLCPVGQHWTVAIALAHIAFWDRRVLAVLDATEQEGKVSAPPIDISANDLLLPFWVAMPPRQAAQIAIESAEALDKRLKEFPPALREEVYAQNARWVLRDLHRNTHLDEINAALA